MIIISLGRDDVQSPIVRPLSDDGLVGFDKDGHLLAAAKGVDATAYHYVRDMRGQHCAICYRGWEVSGPSLIDQMEWDVVGGIVHQSCLARHWGLRQRETFWRALCDARVRFSGLGVIPNGYYGPSDRWGSHQPWYEAELLDHPAKFVLGSRKRVDHVEVRAQGGTELTWHEAAAEAFKAEEVTKHFTPSSVLLHAWNDEKTKSYLKTLVEVAGYRKPGGSAHKEI